MWNEDYETLNSTEKEEFRRLTNYLLSHTYVSRHSYDPAQKITSLNKDYQRISRFFPLLRDYFSVSGWRLEKDENYGFLSLTNLYDHNRYRLDQFTTLFLYTCRLLYEEWREQDNRFHVVKTDTSEVVQKMEALGLRKSGKTTRKEFLEAQRTLAHFNVIEKMESAAWQPEGNQILILPSILAILSNSSINNLAGQLDVPRGGESEDAPETEADNA